MMMMFDMIMMNTMFMMMMMKTKIITEITLDWIVSDY